jgi:hypothetical protein
VTGGTPPVEVNVETLLTDVMSVTGLITRGGFTVTVELDKFNKESVTRTTTVPEEAGAVKTPVEELILPPPLKIEYV